MKHIFLVSNNLMSKVNVVYPKETTFNEVREKTMLSKKGEDKASDLLKVKELKEIEVVYSSTYFSALNTSKYFAQENDLDIVVDSRLNERVVGELGCNEYRFLKGMQEHDFTYKLEHGESILEVQKRMNDFLDDLLRTPEENILVVTHNIALLSLAINWCNKEFNLDDRLILDYHNNVIFDGVFHDMDIIEVGFNKNQFLGIRRIM